MTTPYTKAAALRLLLGLARKIETVREYRNCIQVTYRVSGGARCSTFLSKKAFVVVNHDFRASGALTIEVVEVVDDDTFIVKSNKTSKPDNYYVVRPYHWHEKSRCECGDCHWRGAKCKHQIAVQQFLTGQLLVA
jgi:hypothetical protein